MSAPSVKTAHKLGANWKETARMSRPARSGSESKDVHEDRGTVKSKFSQPKHIPARPTPAPTVSQAPPRTNAAAPWPDPGARPAGHTPDTGGHTVHLRLFKDGAQRVCVAGTFNNWAPQRTPLHRNQDGEWEVTLALAPGDYEYRFVADDEWIDDPLACQHAANPFGGVNAVLHVHGGPV